MTRRRRVSGALAVALFAGVVVGRSSARAQAPASTLYTNTAHVEAIALGGGALWAATRGGLERYDAETHRRTRLYTTLDGLATNALHGVRVEAEGVVVTAYGSRCVLGTADRFRCTPDDAAFRPRIAPARKLGDARVTAELPASAPRGARWVGTTQGLFFVDPAGTPSRLTPEGQICSNHVTDVVAHDGRVYFGAFKDGMCVREAGVFRRIDTPFRMVNDLQSAGRELYVAASEGLFRSRDGKTFTRFRPRAVPRGANGLDYDGRHLWVTTPASLHRLRLARDGEPSRSWWRPGGSVAVQDVAVRGDGSVWLVTEDRGTVRMTDDGPVLFDRTAGLPSSWHFTVDVDRAQAAWVGTLRDGLVRIDPDTGAWTRVALPDAWLLRVRSDRGGLLVGTQGGAFLVRGGAVIPIADVPDPRVHELARIDDTLWVGTEGGTLATRMP